MKLGASVYVPTPQFFATIINRSCGCGLTGRGLPRIMGQTKLEIRTFSEKDVQRERRGWICGEWAESGRWQSFSLRGMSKGRAVARAADKSHRRGYSD